MKTNFCVCCGALNDLEHHHILPKVLGGDCSDANMITFCYVCHDKIHSFKRNSNRKVLQKIGIEKAKLRGVYKGRQRSITDEQIKNINSRLQLGESKVSIAKNLGISRDTLYRYIQ